MSKLHQPLCSTSSRRQFLSRLALAGAAFPLSGFGGGSKKRAASEEEWTVHIFSKHLQFLGYEAMAETAAEIGFDGVDLTVREGGHILPENVEKDLPRAVQAVHEAGLKADMMTTDITDPREPYAASILRTASDLGIRYYRTGKLPYREELGVEKTLRSYEPTFRRLAAANERYHIHGDYQNHTGTQIGGPVWDLWVLLDGLEPSWVGCQYDIRHATVEGARSWPLGLNLLAPHVGTIVIKDFRWEENDGEWEIKDVPLGEGMVDFGAYFRQLEDLSIRVPISLHFEYEMVADANALSTEERRRRTIEVMQEDLQWLRAMLEEAGV